MRRLDAHEIDELAIKIEALEAKASEIREQLKEQVAEYGFVPPRSEKSRRVEGVLWRATLSGGTSTTIVDTEVEKIRTACDEGIFAQLFRTVTKYVVSGSAHQVLAGILPDGAPKNLRALFQRAVILTERAPSLKIEKIKAA